MTPPDRKELDVRRMLAGPLPAVPADLASRAAARGGVLRRRRRALRRLGWWLLLTAAVAFLVWASLARPWVVPSESVAPPLEGW
ncbi:hypothetical protein [Streptomyces sp. NPDC089799]|uniref:hypothetical protein n=1 Tax=Streptomyces sp. NPDC089799 TaxID=3155066 RepID=UPI00341A9C83